MEVKEIKEFREFRELRDYIEALFFDLAANNRNLHNLPKLLKFPKLPIP